MDTRFDEDEAVLSIDIVLGALEVLADVSSLLDEIVKFFWEGWGNTVSLKDADNLGAGDREDLTDAVAVTKGSADLGWADTLASVIADKLDALWTSDLEPVWSGAAVWNGRGGDTVAWRVETTHIQGKAKTIIA